METLVYVSNVLLLILPFVVVLALYVFKIFEAKLPVNQQKALDTFTNIAVQYVEQTSKAYTSTDKKNFAVKAVVELFTEFHLPVPSMNAIDTAIESAVYALNLFTTKTGDAAPTTTPTPAPLQGALADTAFQMVTDTTGTVSKMSSVNAVSQSLTTQNYVVPIKQVL